jgi:hypothetical protein
VYPQSWLEARRPGTFEVADPGGPAFNLVTIAGRLGVQVDSSHRPMADVETTMSVFLGLRALLEEYDPGTLDRLATLASVSAVPITQASWR